MKITVLSSLIMLTAALMLSMPSADAQRRRGNDRHESRYQGPGYRIDHRDHVIRDSHGHVIGRYHHNVIHQNSNDIIPPTSAQHTGRYYVENGQYFYYPQTTGSRYSASYRSEQISFGGFSHVDDLAARLETLSNELCLDLHYNYSHNPGFQETYREAYQVLEVARFIHAAEHQNDRLAIQEQLGGLDRLFHHIQDDVRGWTRHPHRQIGDLGILSKMELIESTLHHLMNDVGVKQTNAAGVEQAPLPGDGPEQAPAPLTIAPLATFP